MKAVRVLLLSVLAALCAGPGVGTAEAADAVFEVTGDRPDNFRAAVTLRNPESRAVTDWTLEMRLERTVIQAFGADANEVEPGRWRFRPVDWTREIPARGEIRFTFIGRPGALGTAAPDMKLDVTLADAAPAPAPQAYTSAPQASTPRPKPPTATARRTEPVAPNAGSQRPVTPAAAPGTAVPHTLGFKVKDSWPDGFVGEIAVINGSDKALRPWRFEFAMEGRIEDAWGADVKSAGDGRWVATPQPYNREIEPGGFATFGFKASTPFKGGPTSTRFLQGE